MTRLIQRAQTEMNDDIIITTFLERRLKKAKKPKGPNGLSSILIVNDDKNEGRFALRINYITYGDNWSGDWSEDHFLIGDLEKEEAKKAAKLLASKHNIKVHRQYKS